MNWLAMGRTRAVASILNVPRKKESPIPARGRKSYFYIVNGSLIKSLLASASFSIDLAIPVIIETTKGVVLKICIWRVRASALLVLSLYILLIAGHMPRANPSLFAFRNYKNFLK